MVKLKAKQTAFERGYSDRDKGRSYRNIFIKGSRQSREYYLGYDVADTEIA